MLYLKWIANKAFLYSTQNCAQCYVTAWMGGESGGEWIHVWLSPFAIHLSQHCSSTRPQYKIKKFLKKKKYCAFTAGGAVSIPGQETNILQPAQHNWKNTNNNFKKKIDDTLYSCYFIHPMSNWNMHENHPWCWLEMQMPGPQPWAFWLGRLGLGPSYVFAASQVHVILTEVTSVLLKEVEGVCGLSTLGPVKPCPSSAFLQWVIFMRSHTHSLWSCFFAARNRRSSPWSGLESHRTLFTSASHP